MEHSNQLVGLTCNHYELPKTLSETLELIARQSEQLKLQEAMIERAKQKIEFVDDMIGSSSAIDIGYIESALNMGVGRNKIFAILRDLKILDRKNTPYQSYIDRGYFRTIESSYTKPDGTTCINIKTVIFQKGLDFIRKTINKHISDK